MPAKRSDERRIKSAVDDREIDDDAEIGVRSVDFPEVEDEYGMGDFERDAAQQVGRFSDQVMLGSPASEAGVSGQDSLQEIVNASKKKLTKKVKKK